MDNLTHLLKMTHLGDKKFWLLAEKAYYLIERKRMKGIDKAELKKEIEKVYPKGNFNLYRFIADRWCFICLPAENEKAARKRTANSSPSSILFQAFRLIDLGRFNS